MEPVADNTLNIEKYGNWLVVTNHELLGRLLYDALSYRHVLFLREFGKTSVTTIRKECYEIEKEKEGKSKLIARAGFLSRILKLAESNGIKVTLRESERRDAKYIVNVEVLDTLKLRPLQSECLIAILQNHCGVIKASTGFGKSFLIPIICKLFDRAKIDIVTKRKDVAKSIYQSCVQEDLRPGIVTSGVAHRKDTRVTVYTAGSLGHSDYSADIVIGDECHELVTPSYSQYLFRYIHARMYGLSASPDTRADGSSFIVEQIFGPPIFEASHTDILKLKSVVPIVVRWIPVPELPVSSNLPDVVQRRLRIWTNPVRNKAIAQVAQQYYNEGKQVLIIVVTIEHALYLKRELPDFVICSGTISEQTLRRMRKRGIEVDDLNYSGEGRMELSEAFKRRDIMGVIATGVWTTGVSFDDLDVLIRADGQASRTASVQIPGRVCRVPKLTDKEVGLLIDFVDIGNGPGFRSACKRFEMYKKLGYIQCDPNFNKIPRLSVLKQHIG